MYYDVTVKFEVTGENSFGEKESLVMSRTRTYWNKSEEGAKLSATKEHAYKGRKIVGVSAVVRKGGVE